MVCFRWQRLIDTSLDANTPLPPEAAEHLRDCAACRLRYERERRVAEELTAEAAQIAPGTNSGLEERILRSLRESGTRPMPRQPLPFLRPLAAAACLLVALGGALWVRHTQREHEARVVFVRETLAFGEAVLTGTAPVRETPMPEAPPRARRDGVWHTAVEEGYADEVEALHADLAAAQRFFDACLPVPLLAAEE